MSLTTQKPVALLPNFLKKVIDAEIERVTNEELDKAIKRIEQRKAEVVAGAILMVQKNIQMETLAEHLVITVQLK